MAAHSSQITQPHRDEGGKEGELNLWLTVTLSLSKLAGNRPVGMSSDSFESAEAPSPAFSDAVRAFELFLSCVCVCTARKAQCDSKAAGN